MQIQLYYNEELVFNFFHFLIEIMNHTLKNVKNNNNSKHSKNSILSTLFDLLVELSKYYSLQLITFIPVLIQNNYYENSNGHIRKNFIELIGNCVIQYFNPNSKFMNYLFQLILKRID